MTFLFFYILGRFDVVIKILATLCVLCVKWQSREEKTASLWYNLRFMGPWVYLLNMNKVTSSNGIYTITIFCRLFIFITFTYSTLHQKTHICTHTHTILECVLLNKGSFLLSYLLWSHNIESINKNSSTYTNSCNKSILSSVSSYTHYLSVVIQRLSWKVIIFGKSGELAI